MLTLRPPFSASNYEALSRAVMGGKFTPIDTHYTCHAELTLLLKQMLQVSVILRPTASELLALRMVQTRMVKTKAKSTRYMSR